MKFLLGVVFVFSFSAQAMSYLSFSRQVVEQTWKDLKACGLERRNAWDADLPRPQVRATEAVVNKAGRVLAYYYESFGPGGVLLEFKNPLGGLSHKTYVYEKKLKFVTPYAGTVARVNRYKTINGYGHYMYCNDNRRVPYVTFERCVMSLYVDVITKQLCRFS